MGYTSHTADVIEEVWKSVLGFEGLYSVSDSGKVKSHTKMRGAFEIQERIMKPAIKRNGYYQIVLSKDHFKKYPNIHRLVAIHFIPNPLNLPEVNHKDGDKSNNNVENLEWTTSSNNQKHAYKLGLQRQDGENHATLKLNWIKVREIREMHKQGISHSFLGETFGVHPGHIKNIIANIYWKEK